MPQTRYPNFYEQLLLHFVDTAPQILQEARQGQFDNCWLFELLYDLERTTNKRWFYKQWNTSHKEVHQLLRQYYLRKALDALECCRHGRFGGTPLPDEFFIDHRYIDQVKESTSGKYLTTNDAGTSPDEIADFEHQYRVEETSWYLERFQLRRRINTDLARLVTERIRTREVAPSELGLPAELLNSFVVAVDSEYSLGHLAFPRRAVLAHAAMMLERRYSHPSYNPQRMWEGGQLPDFDGWRGITPADMERLVAMDRYQYAELAGWLSWLNYPYR